MMRMAVVTMTISIVIIILVSVMKTLPSQTSIWAGCPGSRQIQTSIWAGCPGSHQIRSQICQAILHGRGRACCMVRAEPKNKFWNEKVPEMWLLVPSYLAYTKTWVRRKSVGPWGVQNMGAKKKCWNPGVWDSWPWARVNIGVGAIECRYKKMRVETALNVP